MKQFIKTHFKFIFTIVWVTLIVIGFEIRLSKMNNKYQNWLSSHINGIDTMAEANYQCLRERLDFLGKTVIDEHSHTRAYEYITYVEIIKAMNHHAGFKNDHIELLDYKKTIDELKKSPIK